MVEPLGAAAACGTKIVDNNPVYIGYTAHVAESAWVDVKNIRPVENLGNALWAGPLSYGDSCRIDFGGDLIVLGFIDGDRAEVVYSARYPWDSGTECPSGIRTTMELSHLATMNDDYRAKVEEIMFE